MAVIYKVDDEGIQEWLKSRPQIIQELYKCCPADRLYRIKSTGKRGLILSYCEDGTVTVAITGQYNLVAIDQKVFGLKPDDIEECDLPEPSETLGTVYTHEEEIQEYIENVREEMQRRKQQ